MANDYCTLAELKAALPDSGLSSTDITAYDTILASCITRASRLIDKETKRNPGAFAVSTSTTDEETRYYTGSGNAYQWVEEMAGAPSLVAMSEAGGVQSSDYTTVPSTDYFCYPDNAANEGKPYTRLDMDTINGAYALWYRYRKSIKITAAFGYSYADEIPDDIKQACIIQAARWFKRGGQGFGDAAVVPELATMRYVKNLDPDVSEILAHFKRTTI